MSMHAFGLTGELESLRSSNRAAHTLEQGIVGGERNTSSLGGNNYDATKHEANMAILANVTSAQNIGGSAVPVFIMGIQIRTALTGTLTISGFLDPTGAAKNWVLPIGSVGQVLPPGNARRADTGCTMTLSVATDGDFVAVDWRPIF